MDRIQLNKNKSFTPILFLENGTVAEIRHFNDETHQTLEDAYNGRGFASEPFDNVDELIAFLESEEDEA